MSMTKTLAPVLMVLVMTSTLSAAEARVLETAGRVEIRPAPDADWAPLQDGMVVPGGATISTGFGAAAVIQVGPAARLEVAALSRLTLEQLIEREGLVESDLHLSVGRVRAEIEAVEGIQSDFNLSSPVSTAAVRGTSFEYDGVNVFLTSGDLDFRDRFNRSVFLRAGERSRVIGDNDPTEGDVGREEDTGVVIYMGGLEEDTESPINERESDAARLQVDIRIEEPVGPASR